MSALLSSVVPDSGDAQLAQVALEQVRDALAAEAPGGPHDPVRLTVPDAAAEIVIPRAVLDLLSQALAHLANGEGVTLVPAHAELTTQQAADMLNVSRPFLIGLLEDGRIGYRQVGTHRRVLAESLIRYMAEDDARRKKAADELSAMTRELGMA